MNIPFFPFYVNDWLGGTNHLSDTECGVLIRVWCHLWRNGERTGNPTLADDDRVLARLLGRSVSGWRRVKQGLTEGENAPLEITNGRLVSQCVTRSFEKALSKYLSQREGARRTNRKLARSGTDTVTDPATGTDNGDTRARFQNQMSEPDIYTEPNSHTLPLSPSRGHQEPDRECVCDESSHECRPDPNQTLFERFWEAYPKKVGRDAARRAFHNVRLRLPDEDILLASIRDHMERDERWRNERYIPNPSTYLLDGRWKDRLDAPRWEDDPLQVALAEGR